MPDETTPPPPSWAGWTRTRTCTPPPSSRTAGVVLGTEAFSTTRAGYRAMLRWFHAHTELLRVGVEQTGSYGAGLTRHLALAGVPVLEVTGPEPPQRRSQGKDDRLDAVAAARAALEGRRVQVAKDRSGAVEALRVLRATRATAREGASCRASAAAQHRHRRARRGP